MNKEIKKAAALLKEKETQRAEIIAKYDNEIKVSHANLSDITAKLDRAEDAEQFTRLAGEKRDYEAAITFFEKKKAEANGPILSKEEYKTIREECKKNFDVICENTRKELKAEIDKVNNIMAVYDAELTELNNVIKQAGILSGDNNPIVLNYQNLSGDFATRQYLEVFHRLKYAKEQGLTLD